LGPGVTGSNTSKIASGIEADPLDGTEVQITVADRQGGLIV